MDAQLLKGRVSRISFDTRHFSESERISAFALFTQSQYECAPVGETKAFAVQTTGYRVADLIFAMVTFSPATFRRTERQLPGGGSDFLVFEAQIPGEQKLVRDVGPLLLLPRHIHFARLGLQVRIRGDSDEPAVARHTAQPAAVCGPARPRRPRDPLVQSTGAAEGHVLPRLWWEPLENLEQVMLAEAERLTYAFVGFVDRLPGRRQALETPVTLAAMQQFLIRSDTICDSGCRSNRAVTATAVDRLDHDPGDVLVCPGRAGRRSLPFHRNQKKLENRPIPTGVSAKPTAAPSPRSNVVRLLLRCVASAPPFPKFFVGKKT